MLKSLLPVRVAILPGVSTYFDAGISEQHPVELTYLTCGKFPPSCNLHMTSAKRLRHASISHQPRDIDTLLSSLTSQPSRTYLATGSKHLDKLWFPFKALSLMFTSRTNDYRNKVSIASSSSSRSSSTMFCHGTCSCFLASLLSEANLYKRLRMVSFLGTSKMSSIHSTEKHSFYPLGDEWPTAPASPYIKRGMGRTSL